MPYVYDTFLSFIRKEGYFMPEEKKYLYVEMACPPEIAESLIRGMEARREVMQKGYIIGEWLDRSRFINSEGMYSWNDMMILDPCNIAFILYDFRVREIDGVKRVFLQIQPANWSFFNEVYKEGEWVFLPRVIGNKKTGTCHFITVDIKKKVDDHKMMTEAMIQELFGRKPTKRQEQETSQ